MDHPALITFYVIIGILAIVGTYSGFKFWKESKAWRKQRNDEMDSRYSNSVPQGLASPSQGSCHDRSPPGVWNGVFGARRRSTVTPGAAESGLGKHNTHITPRRSSVRAGIVNSGHSMSMHPGTLVFTDSGRPPPVPRAVAGRYASPEDSAKSTTGGDRTSITTKTNADSTTKVFDVATSRASGSRFSNMPLQSSKQDQVQKLSCPSQEASVGEVMTARLVDIKHASSFSVKAARALPLFHKKHDDRIGQSDRVELPAHRVENPNETPISPSQSEIGERDTSNQDPQDVLVSPQSSRVGHSSLGRIAEDAIVSPCSNDKQRRWSWSADDDSAVRGRS